MKRIARFEKVSFEQFLEGWGETLNITDRNRIREIYDGIRLPRRATAGSAGYDFFAPADITLRPGETIKIPTGVRVWSRNGCSSVIRAAGWDSNTGCSLITQWELLTVIIIIQIMKVIFSLSSPMTVTRRKPLNSKREKDLCRGSSWNTELLSMMMQRKSETADLEAQQNNQAYKNVIILRKS